MDSNTIEPSKVDKIAPAINITSIIIENESTRSVVEVKAAKAEDDINNIRITNNNEDEVVVEIETTASYENPIETTNTNNVDAIRANPKPRSLSIEDTIPEDIKQLTIRNLDTNEEYVIGILCY
jgi:hypothetical protein